MSDGLRRSLTTSPPLAVCRGSLVLANQRRGRSTGTVTDKDTVLELDLMNFSPSFHTHRSPSWHQWLDRSLDLFGDGVLERDGDIEVGGVSTELVVGLVEVGEGNGKASVINLLIVRDPFKSEVYRLIECFRAEAARTLRTLRRVQCIPTGDARHTRCCRPCRDRGSVPHPT